MSLSIIIAHYAPKMNCEKYFKLLKDNINAIKEQNFTEDYEIILCDDGSYWTRDLFKDDNILILNHDKISNQSVFDELNIDKYYGLKDVNKYRGVILKDRAIRESSFNKVIILDDDHHLIHKNEFRLFSKYLDKYKYVKGRVIGPDNIPQLFWSRNAQGTTYGFQKELYINSGGFSKYLYNNGIGEDNDILHVFYKYLTQNFSKKVSCFAADISTFDLATNRWLDRSLSISEYERSQLLNSEENYKIFETNFKKVHGIHPIKGNPSRVRYKWMVIPNAKGVLIEMFFTLRYIFSIHKVIKKTIKIIKAKIDRDE